MNFGQRHFPFLSLTPSSPPFVNSTPAASSVRILLAPEGTVQASFMLAILRSSSTPQDYGAAGAPHEPEIPSNRFRPRKFGVGKMKYAFLALSAS
jgi:hypothetical protein